MLDGGVRLDCDGPVATVTLCRPDVLNAQTPGTWVALREFSRDLPGNIRVVILRGEGRAFSAGLDRSVLTGAAGGDSAEKTFSKLVRLPADQCADRIGEFQEAFTWLRRPDLITIAAVQGHAIGAGFQLALACDMRVVADDALFCMAEVTYGLVPDLGGTKRLVELIGYGRALELCVTGRRVSASEALAIGLANIMVPRAELDSAVRDLAAAILAGNRAAISEIKALLSGAADRSYADQDRAEREAQTRRLADLAGLGD